MAFIVGRTIYSWIMYVQEMEYLVVLHKTKRMSLYYIHLLDGMDAHDPGKAIYKVQFLRWLHYLFVCPLEAYAIFQKVHS